MRRMLLVALAAASVSLSAGAALAQQAVVCQPICGLVHASEAGKQNSLKGKTTAASHMNQQGLNHNNAGIKPPTDPGPVILF